MPHVEVIARMDVDADTLWQEVGSFQGIGRWHPTLARVEGHGEDPGSFRTAEASDGSKQIERLQEIDPQRHFYRYTMVSTPMPVTDYAAEFRVRPEDEHFCKVFWTADFHVNSGNEAEVAGMIRAFFDAGLQSLQRKHPARKSPAA